MEIKIIFNNKEIVFGEWESIGSKKNYSMCLKRTAFKGTYIEWVLNYTNNGTYWFRNFQGVGDASGLYSLRYAYDRIYPILLFNIDQEDEAKNHMDNFLNKINILKVFV